MNRFLWIMLSASLLSTHQTNKENVLYIMLQGKQRRIIQQLATAINSSHPMRNQSTGLHDIQKVCVNPDLRIF